MLTIWGNKRSFCGGVSRRDFLRLGALGLGGLTLADLLRLRAQAANPPRQKAVIMICLQGGPSQFETYDLKPDAPKEIRGEFKPLATKVPGLAMGECFPLQAQIAGRLAVLRGVDFSHYNKNDHSIEPLFSGYHSRVTERPSFGSVYSRLYGSLTAAGMPSYVSLNRFAADGQGSEKPAYLGAAHRPFVYAGQVLKDLQLPKGLSANGLADRKRLLHSFDSMRRNLDAKGEMAEADAFTARALELIASPKVREAFDINKESAPIRDKYGPAVLAGTEFEVHPSRFLLARRLVEAGVPVVTLTLGGWDTHSKNFETLRKRLPTLDRAVHALVTDLAERGLDKDVLLVLWGEMGRTPKINTNAGRDHWLDAGIALLAGGGLKMGQVVGETDSRGEKAKSQRYVLQNVLATVYQVLGIDLETTLPDHAGRPQYLLDDRAPIQELF